MNARAETVLIAGAAGAIETIVELPEAAPRGITLVCHPHPLFGGANSNKVTHTLARAALKLGDIALRPNFRGVGDSAGTHADGAGETDDMLTVLAWARQRWGDLPVSLAGFSFGAYVQTRVAQALAEAGHPARRMALVGTAAGYVEGARHYETAAVPATTLIIHGARDETVPLANVLAWAEPLDLPVVVIPGADHFFHRRLPLIRDLLMRAWRD
ncbi:alpha/beta hydrolase [Rhodocyclus tenuis]|uniref:Alpha/beta hydrolase n=1 Tax=Rhodocyclus gracilis TaxID=2929842 RepID=A0ABX0WHY8_9RHOO|nr:CocE/NonD family hydrolase [Rhodocyclus gracilis]MRD73419.1 alpha/beta hydrolase [Rhodocyclus gracilis]NJA88471.1 alpha/beta hydrolase [Rhodocyclus gracilis]